MEAYGNILKTLQKWEIPVLVLTSLFMQILLTIFADRRRRTHSGGRHLLIWLSYLSGVWVAEYSLGNLSGNKCHSENPNGMLATWGPFLLLHLGGPDTITSFSVDDNELWLRSLFAFLAEVAMVTYVFYKSLPKASFLLPAILVFVSGFLKCVERTVALWSSSTERLRVSIIPSRGSRSKSYSELHQEFMFKYRYVFPRADSIRNHGGILDDEQVLSVAYHSFRIFWQLFIDLHVSDMQVKLVRPILFAVSAVQVFRLIDIELFFMYEMLHTKATVLHMSRTGIILRLLAFCFFITAFVFFLLADKYGHSTINTSVTLVLFGGTLALEIYSLVQLLLSEWTIVQLQDRKYKKLSKTIYSIATSLGDHRAPRWSNFMSQYNLIQLCVKDKPTTTMNKIASALGVKDRLHYFLYTGRTQVNDNLKELICNELGEKLWTTQEVDSQIVGNFRGEWALKYHNIRYFNELGWSVTGEFDQSILIWHIATELCYYELESDHVLMENRKAVLIENAKAISEYMFSLLISRPFMLPPNIGLVRYSDAFAVINTIFSNKEWPDTMREACDKIKADFGPSVISLEARDEGDSRKVVHYGVKLWKQLMEIISPTERWEVMSSVWVEMLCYAAGKCRGSLHAKQLSAGGELLSHVWFLMSHLGIGEKYRFEPAPAAVFTRQ